MRCELVAIALLLAACDRPEPVLICHNANCLGPDVTRDDTLDAMAGSLALERDGRPVLDGIEWDLFWYGAESRCLFAHDLVHDTSVPWNAPADLVAGYLASHPRASWRGDRFYAFMDLKAHVGPEYSDAPTPEQLVQLAECALDSAERLVTGAWAGNHALTIGFIGGRPEQLEVLRARPRWAELANATDVELMMIGDIFAPYASIVPKLEDYTVPLDAVEYHPDFMTAEHRETYRALGMDLVQWSYVATTEALDAIERWDPRFVITNEAMLLRRWTQD